MSVRCTISRIRPNCCPEVCPDLKPGTGTLHQVLDHYLQHVLHSCHPASLNTAVCVPCRVEKAVAAGATSGSEDFDPALSSAIADLHKFSMMQSMYKSAVHLLEDLQQHIKLLHTPERAQVGT